MNYMEKEYSEILNEEAITSDLQKIFLIYHHK